MIDAYLVMPGQNAVVSGPCFIKNIRVQSANNYAYRIRYDTQSDSFSINAYGSDSIDFVYDLNWVVVDNAHVKIENNGTTPLYAVITYEPIDGTKAGLYIYDAGGSQFDVNFSEDAIVTSIFINASPQPITLVSPVSAYSIVTEAEYTVITDINWPVSPNGGVSFQFYDAASFVALMYVKK